MPLDVLGRTRATLNRSTCSPFPRGTGKPLNPIRGRDRGLQLFPVNQEFLVGASHKLASITSLPFVHTARRYYRLNGLVSSVDCYAPLATSERDGKQIKLDHLEEVKVVTRFP